MPSRNTQPKMVEMKEQPMGGNGQLALLLSIVAVVVSVYNFSKLQTLEKFVGGGANIAKVSPAPSQQVAPEEPKADLTKVPALTDKDWIRGSKDAQVVMIEYSDYQCPFCQRFHPTMQQIMKDYQGKVAWVFRQYPLSFHPFAQKAAEAGECVGKIGGNDKFWTFTDKAYELGAKDENALAVDNLVKMAGEMGVDATKVRNCVTSGEMAAKVKADMDGGSAAGVTGTPGTILIAKNGKRDFVPGAYPVQTVKDQLDKLMQ